MLFLLDNGIIRKTQKVMLQQDGADLSISETCPSKVLPPCPWAQSIRFLYLGGQVRF